MMRPGHVRTAGGRTACLASQTGSAGCVLLWLCGMRRTPSWRRGYLGSLGVKVWEKSNICSSLLVFQLKLVRRRAGWGCCRGREGRWGAGPGENPCKDPQGSWQDPLRILLRILARILKDPWGSCEDPWGSFEDPVKILEDPLKILEDPAKILEDPVKILEDHLRILPRSSRLLIKGSCQH